MGVLDVIAQGNEIFQINIQQVHETLVVFVDILYIDISHHYIFKPVRWEVYQVQLLHNIPGGFISGAEERWTLTPSHLDSVCYNQLHLI